MLPGLQDEANLLLDEGGEGVQRRVGQVLAQDAKDDLGAAKDGLAQLARFLQLLAQLLTPLQKQLLKMNKILDEKPTKIGLLGVPIAEILFRLVLL